MDKITMAHGSGGKVSHQLIADVFFRYLDNDILRKAEDSAVIELKADSLAFTTDSFVVKPLFFPGGDIGKIAVCGTVNDLAVSGARPLYMTCGFILEEGFSTSGLEKIVKSMAEWARKAGVKIVAGDTKVVGRGEADGVFINTSGVGANDPARKLMVSNIRPGDKIMINGTIGDHGVAVLGKRKGLTFESDIVSDCAPLNHMLDKIMANFAGIRFMRDPTRGGVATTLNEITAGADFGIQLEETSLPVAEGVKGACELLGLDPLYIANEGKVLIIADPADEEAILKALRADEYGKCAVTIGEVTGENEGKVCLKTRYGVTRIVDMLTAEQLPRIC